MENEHRSTGDVLDALAQLNNTAAHLDIASPEQHAHDQKTQTAPGTTTPTPTPPLPDMHKASQPPAPSTFASHTSAPTAPAPQPSALTQASNATATDAPTNQAIDLNLAMAQHSAQSQHQQVSRIDFEKVGLQPTVSSPQAEQHPVPLPTASNAIELRTDNNTGNDSNTNYADDDANGAANTKSSVPLGQPYYGCPPWTAVSRFFRKYAVFIGRASRSEYWWLALIYSLSYAAIIPLSIILMTTLRAGNPYLLAQIWTVLTVIPLISLGVRRLHDANISGVWYVPILVFTYGVGFFAIFGRNHAPGDASSSSIVLFMLFLGILTICALVGLTINVIVMMMPSNPKGRRFDFRLHRRH